MLIDVITLFPRMFEGVCSESILKLGQQSGKLRICIHDLRRYSADARHHKVDAPPYGGGAGMVIQAEPVLRAVEALRADGRARSELVLLTPAGAPFSQVVARELAERSGLILLCGHYEGFDERVVELLAPREISIGDYVLTGGEIPAMVVLDAVARLVPGVLGSEDSAADESFAAGRLEYPHYTRPAVVRGREVPPVLRSGDHAGIARWRDEQAEARTRTRRPDLVRGKEADPRVSNG
jgi:tRNA (guanine37-N1)-methyltransferase